MTHLPWSMIPAFKPGETDVNEYAKKLEFLSGLWPQEHLSHLAPRAAMLCEGSSFKRVMRLDPSKLKVNSTSGVKLLVTTLGGIWGRSTLEDKFERFERAIFTTIQRPDETHESYLARHDFQFEELLQMGVGFKEMRAYILLRNSGLNAEDKKKLIVDSQGNLAYEEIVSSLKLLGSKFFHEVQSGSKTSMRSKTYDVNVALEEEWGNNDDDVAFMGETWDESEIPYDESDPDAMVCLQFEDSLVDALQGDQDLALCYNAYMDERKRLTDRNKNRGFWNSSKGYHNSSKGKGKGKFKGANRFREPLSQRILKSECRRCGQRGHWKAECPLNRSSSSNPVQNPKDSTAFTGMTMSLDDDDVNDMVVIENHVTVPCLTQPGELPEAICLGTFHEVETPNNARKPWSMSQQSLTKFVQAVKDRLSPQPRTASEPHESQIQPGSSECAMFVSHGPFGIVDLGASQTVIGEQQVSELLHHLPQEIRSQVRNVPCRTVFRFGNSSTVTCNRAILVPLAKWHVKICVVASKTPFLISNNVFRTLGAQINTAEDSVNFSNLDVSLPLSLSEKKLYLLDFCELIRLGNQKHARPTMEKGLAEHNIMNSTADLSEEEVTMSSQDQFQRFDQSSSDTQPVVPSSDSIETPHQDVQPISRRSPSSCDSSETSRGVPKYVVRAALGDEDCVWGNEGEPEVHRCDQGGPQVCAVVRSKVHWQQEDLPPTVPLLCGALRGTSGASPGQSNVQGDQGASANDVHDQVEGSSPKADRSGESWELVRIRTKQAMECGAGGESGHADRVGAPEGSDLQHGEQPQSDCGPTAKPDAVSHAEQPDPSLLSEATSGDHLRTLMCDLIGQQMMLDQPHNVIDETYFSREEQSADIKNNWVYQEMWTYFSKKFPNLQSHQIQQHWKNAKLDILEVYCSADSEITHQGKLLGLSTIRFGLQQGDLSTFGGRCRLYDLLWTYRPKHIWLAPRCGPWSLWNRLNMNKSLKLQTQISSDRKSESVHLWLCDALFRLQHWRPGRFHAHLEQPAGSEMIEQSELRFVVTHALCVQCDMCMAGQLRHPISTELLRKKTQVWTTSPILWRMLQQYQCLGQHAHDVIAGSCKPKGFSRMAVSKYSEKYTSLFGRRICRALQCSSQVSECPVREHYALTETTDDQEEASEPKRRRLNGKFHPEHLFNPLPETAPCSSTDTQANARESPVDIRQLIHLAEQCAPRVGKTVVDQGPLFDGVIKMFPDKQIVVLDVCRGTNRLRTCPIGSKGLAPFRRCFGRKRDDLQPFQDEAWESWEQLSKRQQTRAGVPARIMITVFASNKRISEGPEMVPSKRSHAEEETSEGTPEPIPSMPSGVLPVTSQEVTTTKVVPKESGPMFSALSSSIQNQIKKIHQNLGHPDVRTLQLALKRYGWPEHQVRSCQDFVSPVCFEQQQPKIARPAQLKPPRDFNDHVSFDAAEWEDRQGRKFGFYHFIDSATNFHVAIPYHQQTTESLIDAFNTAWIRWAGPPKSLMFDSATEANSEKFSRFLQEMAITSYVIPTDAHWQLGRAERHGAIMKHMISKYHEEHPISNHEEFEQCLIQLCNAKNALSRHEGFTPEMWVLGKMKPLPGSNSNVFLNSASFAGLEDQSTEGSRFQSMLAKRETARIAFIKADHSAAVRKAIHARSRPDRVHFQVGDMVMYWKSGKGVEEGAWHGPAKILMIEGRNLVWISHLTKLFRCAPEHVRKLSADEASGISQAELQSFQLPERSGTGVFQFRELSQQCPPPQFSTPQHVPVTADPDVIVEDSSNTNPMQPHPILNPNNPPDVIPSHPPSSVGQPDAEPICPNNDQLSPNETNESSMDPAVITPIPDDSDQDLVAVTPQHDFWEIQEGWLIRHHVTPRLRMFFPSDAWKCPVPLDVIQNQRHTEGSYITGGQFQKVEEWTKNVSAHLSQPEPWTGKTKFPIQSDEVQHTCHLTSHEPAGEPQCLEAEILMTIDDFHKCLGRTYDYQENFLASAAKRQKVEVKIRELNADDQNFFFQSQR